MFPEPSRHARCRTISRMLDPVFQGLRTFLTASCLLVSGVTSAWSQPTGQLTGVVRDTRGGVLPGVEVSVTSVRGGYSADQSHGRAGRIRGRCAAARALHSRGFARRLSTEGQRGRHR